MNQEKIIEISKKFNIHPSKKLGQNFLINDSVVDKIVEASGVGVNDVVLEIGPGLGVLTQKLLSQVKKLICVEFDTRAFEYLKKNFENNNFEILNQDILQIPNTEITKKLGDAFHVVANIPYNITSPILQKFTEEEPAAKSMTLMIQKEVAQRVCAKPGELSILGVAVQFYADCQIAFYVPKEDFWPIPQVDSAVVKIISNDKYKKLLKVSVKDFFRVVKFGFSARRKKLSNTLSAGLHKKPQEILPTLEKIGLNPNSRAQELTVEQWIELANLIYS